MISVYTDQANRPDQTVSSTESLLKAPRQQRLKTRRFRALMSMVLLAVLIVFAVKLVTQKPGIHQLSNASGSHILRAAVMATKSAHSAAVTIWWTSTGECCHLTPSLAWRNLMNFSTTDAIVHQEARGSLPSIYDLMVNGTRYRQVQTNTFQPTPYWSEITGSYFANHYPLTGFQFWQPRTVFAALSVRSPHLVMLGDSFVGGKRVVTYEGQIPTTVFGSDEFPKRLPWSAIFTRVAPHKSFSLVFDVSIDQRNRIRKLSVVSRFTGRVRFMYSLSFSDFGVAVNPSVPKHEYLLPAKEYGLSPKSPGGGSR